MPFAASVVPQRTQIPEIHRDNAQNILEKSSISHMVGLLQQLNSVSAYASEIFADIFTETDRNAQRIQQVRGRLQRIEQRVPLTEQMFIDNAPSYFYDHPFTQREWQRKDPLHGLIFRRDRCNEQVNRRRGFAQDAPDFSVMDQFSPSGPCSKNYSDPNFFMNEWLEAEKLKMLEEKAKRKARKDRKKKKAKREVKRTIQAVEKKRYNALGAEFGDATVQNTEVAVKQYTLTDENQAMAAELTAGSPPAPADGASYDLDRKSKKLSLAPSSHAGPQASYMNVPPTGGPSSQPSQPSAPINAPGPSAVAQMAMAGRSSSKQPGPPPAAYIGGGAGGPPPVPPSHNINNNNGGGPPPVPGGPGGPGGPPVPPPVAMMQQQQQQQAPPQPKRPLTGAEMAARSAAMAGSYAPPVVPVVQERKEPERPKQQLPIRSMNFLADIKAGKQLKSTANIKREKPVDARSMLLANLRAGANLKHVDPSARDVKPKEEEMDRTVHAILQRRAFLADDSDVESDESWGSESA